MTKPFTIGITGGSGSGKTFFLKNLESRFTDSELCLISQDNYYHPREMQQHDERGIKNFDLPESIDYKQFQLDIQTLKRGEVLKKKEYTFNNPNATPKILEFKPAPVIIVEGLFVQYFPDLEKELDLKIFIEAKDHVKLSRRIKRDNEERGYDLDDVLYRYENHVMPVYETLIKPLKHRADIVIPNNSHFNRALDFLTLAIKDKIAG
ncbi:MAG TPA: P-loop NTPase fold protein [Cyclobacteriaceae bacterium]|nr:uridine kinase [Cyclobacteriaceae bacterium]HMV10088.1 P-loop NTPase fold protein [Cyclobacteriaceae bacterium]HMV88641.1 P-loop NTPase fold protein [Cyclobacteriaceae bacterium]HMX00597.1 P-loop NTPase fold protein [Cyclobacteriaceae bacterium]HMX49528.1 P-loop NTPase fold protein [Cyclobacteriaceae bacterium]